MRALAVSYVIETKDVSVVLCGGKLTEAIMDKKNKNSSELLGQYIVGMAAFKLQNPAVTNENAAQLAGLESTLRAYESMIKVKPKTKHTGLDGLVTLRNNGGLKAFVDEIDCAKK